jgi:5-methylcytosine-specific restriction endonuclease McrA
MISGYPENWNQIAAQIKQRSGYCCQRCGMQCLPPGRGYRHLSRKIRSKYTAQVHHLDRQPSNNNLDNLVALCTGCHLHYHQGQKGNITPGQLSLPLVIDRSYLTPPVFRFPKGNATRTQLSLTIDLHEFDLARSNDVAKGIQLCWLAEK